jgi:hypothetical protein
MKYNYKQGWAKALILVLSICSIITGAIYYKNMVVKSFSFYDCLDYYGFSSDQQKAALEKLMRQASIILPNESFQDKFPIRNNYEELINDILEFVKLTQAHFTIRTGSQERWEVKPSNWMEKNKEESFQYLTTLGFTETIEPKEKSADAIGILGSTMKSMKNRIKYTELLFANGLKTKNIILIAGERIVKAEIDGTDEELKSIANNYHISDLSKLTETHLIKEIYSNSLLGNKAPVYVIDTPARDLSRPTTQTTILELISWLKQYDNIKDIIFVSNQPNVKYQEAVITEVFRNNDVKISFEVVGDSYYDKENLYPIIEALGSYIWAQTPAVLLKLDTTIDDPKIIASIKELYAKQPLVYQNLENLFKEHSSDR